MAIARKLARRPEASLPEAMGDEAMLEGFYRHVGGASTTLEELIRPHVKETGRRVAAATEALAIHDTSGFTFGGKVRRRGLGWVEGKSDQGFLAQVTLAVSSDGTRCPLGILAVGTRARDEEKPASHKESARWALGIDIAESHCKPGQLIHVADRESDIFPLIAEQIGKGRRFIFRSTYDRALADGRRLSDAAEEAEVRFKLEVPISPRAASGKPKRDKSHPPRTGRVAELSACAFTVELKRPQKGSAAGAAPTAVVNVVRVWERDPPNGEPAVEWTLLTSEPIRTHSSIKWIIEAYRARWVIEEYFKAIKTGCAFETRQLESLHALLNTFAYCLIVAYALLTLRALTRAEVDRPAALILSAIQLACLRLLSHGKLEQEPTARSALLRIAALGGHLKRNGEPGWRTLSRGWSKLAGGEEMYLLLNRTCDQS